MTVMSSQSRRFLVGILVAFFVILPCHVVWAAGVPSDSQTAQSATLGLSGRGVTPNTPVDLVITTTSGNRSLSYATGPQAMFNFPATTLQDISDFSLALTFRYSSRNTVGTLIFRYNQAQNRVVVTDTTSRNALVSYIPPGQIREQRSRIQDGRLSLWIENAPLATSLGWGEWKFTIRNVDNQGRDMDPIEFRFVFGNLQGGIDGPYVGDDTSPDGFDPAIGVAGLAALAGLINQTWTSSLKALTDQISSIALSQVKIMGQQEDASLLQDVQLAKQKKTVESQQRYQSDPQFCEITTINQGKSSRDENVKVAASTMTSQSVTARNAQAGTLEAEDDYTQMNRRFEQLKENGVIDPSTNGNSGWGELGAVAGNQAHYNMHVNATEGFSNAKVLRNVNLSDDVVTPEEENFLMLRNNLYGQSYPTIETELLRRPAGQSVLPRLNGIKAVDSIYTQIIDDYAAEKMETVDPDTSASLRQVHIDKGMSPDVAEHTLGATRTSAYAQDDITAKFAILDDEGMADTMRHPVKLLQESGAATAKQLEQDFRDLKLMQDRERLLAGILEMRLREQQAAANEAIRRTMQ